jgi:hypothetical protein
MFGLSCVSAPTWGGRSVGGRTRFHQSCGAACVAPISASTGELTAPSAVRFAEAAGKAIEAAQGLLSVQRLLSEAELNAVETVFRQCVAQAHADVNASYARTNGRSFKNGKFPSDDECQRTVRWTARRQPISLAQELGNLKHAAAFACIREQLPKPLRDHFSLEPRYKGEPELDGTILTQTERGSLKPDAVVHATRNATDVQCVYEFKFPCYERHRLDPMQSPGVQEQLESYKYLSRGCRVTLVTPAGVEPYRSP